MPDLRITVDGIELSADWTDENPDTRDAIADALPLTGDATRWGEELYFRSPVDVDPESTRQVVSEGAVAYWPPGGAVCLFWGPTPASEEGEPRAASDVAVVATIDDVSPLSSLSGGAAVRIERAV